MLADVLASLFLACAAPQLAWLPKAPVTGLKPVLESCRPEGGDHRLVAIRRFKKAGHSFRWIVDPDSFETDVVADECLKCERATVNELSGTRYIRAVEESTTPRIKEDIIQNSGIIHAENKTSGIFLTIDLCPSHKRGLDRSIFLSLEELKAKSQKPVPVALSISGAWLTHHEDGFEWLLDQEHEGQIAITWVNHTLTHPFSPDLPLAHNFLLEKGVHLDREVLGLEKLLLERGIVPSVFFRFPGLVSKADLLEKLRTFLLIPLGSDAWLAKNEPPTAGSIILIHGNLNEEIGVADFLKWFRANQKSASFLGLTGLF
jgi:hypothetical protein